jgi:toxin ParE1/3/4
MMVPSWGVELSDEAAADIRGIVRWTRRRFGPDQAVEYGRTLKAALIELRVGPNLLGIRDCSEAGHGYRMLHVARQGRRGRHFILFRVRLSERRIAVARILHDTMDLARHISPDGDEQEEGDGS